MIQFRVYYCLTLSLFSNLILDLTFSFCQKYYEIFLLELVCFVLALVIYVSKAQYSKKYKDKIGEKITSLGVDFIFMLLIVIIISISILTSILLSNIDDICTNLYLIFVGFIIAYMIITLVLRYLKTDKHKINKRITYVDIEIISTLIIIILMLSNISANALIIIIKNNYNDFFGIFGGESLLIIIANLYVAFTRSISSKDIPKINTKIKSISGDVIIIENRGSGLTSPFNSNRYARVYRIEYKVGNIVKEGWVMFGVKDDWRL